VRSWPAVLLKKLACVVLETGEGRGGGGKRPARKRGKKGKSNPPLNPDRPRVQGARTARNHVKLHEKDGKQKQKASGKPESLISTKWMGSRGQQEAGKKEAT